MTSESSTAAEFPIEDPRVLPFLPLIYVVWADGELSPDEISGICRQVRENSQLDCDCQDLLGGWMDPQKPPSAQDLQNVLATIRRHGADLVDGPPRTLADLGMELFAKFLESSEHTLEPVERKALEKIEAALGVAGQEAARQILAAQRPEPVAEAPPPLAFSPQALTDLLDGPYGELRQEVRAMLAEPAFAYRYGLPKEEFREHTLSLCREVARRGYGSLSFPTSVGGGGDMKAFIAVFETIAYSDLSLLIKLGVQIGLFAGSIHQLGTEKHHEKYLGKAGTMELPGCFAMSEAGHGSNVRDAETTATYDAERQEFVIHTPRDTSRKDWIGNAAAHGQMATVFAQLVLEGEEYGVHAFLVPLRSRSGDTLPGIRIADCGEKLGLNGVDNGRIWFDQVRVPRENLLDRFAQVAADGTYSSPIASTSKRFFTMLGTLVGGRVSIALGASSAAKSGLTIAIRYGQRRRQFGPAGQPETRLLDYLTHQRRLLPRLATTYALHFALQDLVDQHAAQDGDDRREVEALAAGLKAYSSWHTIDTLQTCRECCGGQGYLAVNRFASLKADTDVFATFEGDNTVLLQLVAKGLLGGYRQQFGEMKVLGLVRYLAAQAATSLTELNPIVTRRTDEEHLRDRDFQLSAMAWREQHLLSSAARRLKKRIEGGMDSHEALIDCQDHLVKLALAHVEHRILQSFSQALEAVEDEGSKQVLAQLCDLFALSRLEADRGWYLSQGYLEAGKSKAIRNLVNQLCRELRPQALALVDAFAIPDSVLGAPIALGDLNEPAIVNA
ncbi:MAG: acyl-CoA dehydrogenase family protein [Deltaproteobacteria bacterium]|nr:acyl-CoA dehydrogenase family protein [Deltaproteobacteria bacterium]